MRRLQQREEKVRKESKAKIGKGGREEKNASSKKKKGNAILQRAQERLQKTQARLTASASLRGAQTGSRLVKESLPTPAQPKQRAKAVLGLWEKVFQETLDMLKAASRLGF